jgi:putative ABC transport system permease protein
MLISDLIAISLRQLYRNKRRYRGAILGTSLGIAGLITVLTIGDSVESALGENLEVLGSATVVKCEWDYRKATARHVGQYFEKDIEDLSRLPGVLVVAPAVWGQEPKLTYGRKSTPARLIGVDSRFFIAHHLPVERGRQITPQDVQEKRAVCIIGQNLQKKLFEPDEIPLDKTVRFQGLFFRIIGVLGGAEDPDHMDTVMLPISVARSQIPRMHNIENLYVRAKNWDIIEDLHGEVEKVLRANQPGYAESMRIFFYKDRVSAIQRIVFMFKFFLYAAIVVTLLLGGLGIANVMLAVVKERTTEIGLRKAVGATDGMVVLQFLCESLSVSLLGGVVGILSGAAAVEVLKGLLNTEAAYNVFVLSILASALLALILGGISGVVPAKAAGKLDPVEAMRFE